MKIGSRTDDIISLLATPRTAADHTMFRYCPGEVDEAFGSLPAFRQNNYVFHSTTVRII